MSFCSYKFYSKITILKETLNWSILQLDSDDSELTHKKSMIYIIQESLEHRRTDVYILKKCHSTARLVRWNNL